MQTLPEPDQARLRSSQILTGLHRIVSELVQNALDAQASHIDVGVDPAQWTCWVRDDGTGMTRDCMSMLGKGSAGRYPLASCADLSCLEISSRDASARESWSVITKGGEQIYFGPAVRWRREKPGTVVCVRDAFFNLPVRRLSHPSAQKTMELVRRDIERYGLMSPHVAFTLERSTKDKDGQTNQTRVLTASSSLAAFHGIYGRSLAEHVDELNVKRGDLLVEGFISLRGAPSKAYQFLYVNRSPVEVCELHRLIDSLFACSSFAKQQQDGLEDDQYGNVGSRYSPRKAEWKPVYCLNLHIPREAVDVCLDPDKRSIQFQDRQAVESILSFAVHAFLERNGFATPKTLSDERPSVDEMSSSSPRKRIKSEIAADTAHASSRVANRPLPVEGSTPRPPPDLRVLPDQPDQRSVAWRDPNTGEVFILDSRTGNTIPASIDNSTGTESTSEGQCATSYVDRRWLKRRSPAELGLSSSLPSLGWIQSALDACQSSVFQAPETTIRAIDTRSLEEQQDSPWPSFPSSQVLRGNKAPDGIKHRFARSDLQGAKVVCQVDKKFIACVVHSGEESPGSGSTLILIDQHAADERIRVEHFFKELACQFLDGFRSDRRTSTDGVERSPLPEPTFVLLSKDEIQRLQLDQKLLNYISRSGFEITTPEFDTAPNSHTQPTSVPDAGQTTVTAVPKLLYSRLSKPAELNSVLKAFISMPSDHLADFGQDDEFLSTKDQLSGGWLNAVKAWPPEFINLVNSKACRGAIMFNDSLSVLQCETLISQLAEAIFPYQCAHGRPSVIPLAALSESEHVSRNHRDVSWAKFGRAVKTTISAE
ncbi:hypothetical protein M407DRAFT_20045 [Tulasnella calospora MUT 4182]|uniref:MutL C-terminal dimerisation domain-containing protein n=1 Tax=Tulasnella calospora MUT 4182 TaxID=1051891 RepID=A0A0C3LAL5_9AGAM|nr:hypothetical protein M407DRAFT_20045 [Tulasnella calospora MUT 4182]